LEPTVSAVILPYASKRNSFRSRRRLFLSLASLVCICVSLCVSTLILRSQTLHYPKPPDPKNGERIYKTGCNACHGDLGKGALQTSTEFQRPDTFPDFTQCSGTTAEPNATWKAIIVHGGPSRGFSTIMPAFGDLLSSEQIDDVIAYLRQFCTNPHWPRGELNLPRALVTEKAYPEDEFVISTAMNATGAPGFVTDYIHEQRFGMKNQLEVDYPQNDQDQNHSWQHGPGDITLGVKRVMYTNLRTGSILSLQGGILPPTGDSKRGFGRGTTTFEPFAAFDQLFPSNTFVQFQMGADLPRHPDVSPQSIFYRTAVGQTFASDHLLGRMWSPMVEFLATRNLTDNAKTDWDVLPEMQVTVSRRQHVRAAVGVRTPFTDTRGRTPQVTVYVLWDWADGKLWKGWR
jgi:Cytochrome C oxidase, cbb3-type, subunit III